MTETMSSLKMTVKNVEQLAKALRQKLSGKRFVLVQDNELGVQAATGLALVPAPAWGGAVQVSNYDGGSRAMLSLNYSDGMLVITVPSRENADSRVPRFLLLENGAVIKQFSDEGRPITWTFIIEP